MSTRSLPLRRSSSRPVLGAGRIPDAVREARLSLQARRSGDRRVVPYGTNDRPFMPRTVAEAAAIVDRILGPLIEYDREHNADLWLALQALEITA